MINSDWHVHSEYSYDAKNSLESLANCVKNQNLTRIGITDHANYNDVKFLSDLKNSANAVNEIKEKYPFFVLGVELTPIAKPEFDFIQKNGVREGYIPPIQAKPYDIELAVTKEELKALGVQYAVGASHWRVDKPGVMTSKDVNACIKEWYRQQIYLACDERVTILGHPWYSGERLWYDDFSVIPKSMNNDIFHALKENGKYIECNYGFFIEGLTSEKFRNQYAEFIREAFEFGLKVTYGSDSHCNYSDNRYDVEKHLKKVGFLDGDIVEIENNDLW